MTRENFEWDESKHPRHQSGDDKGGEFAPKGGSAYENVGNRELKIGDRIKVQARMQGGGKRGVVVDTPSRGFVTVEFDDGESAYYHESDLMVRAKKRMSDEERRATFGAKNLTGAEVFAAGTHNGMTFSEADLDAIVSAFDKLNSAGRVPLKFGHNDEQPMTDGKPALGWVDRLWRNGKKLFADFTGMPTVVHDAVKAGRYKFISIELLQDVNRNGDRYPWVLSAAALLGADIPAVNGLGDLQALCMTREIPGIRFSGATAFTSDARFTTNSGDRNTMTDEEIKALKERAEKAEAKLADEQKARFTEKVKAHRESIVAALDKAIEEGRIAPRVKDKIVNTRYFKSDEDVMSWYSMDALKEEIRTETRADFKEAGKRTSVTGKSDDGDFVGKPVGQVLTFRAQAECVRFNGNVGNYDDMVAATGRVLNADKALAKAYYADQNAAYNPQSAA